MKLKTEEEGYVTVSSDYGEYRMKSVQSIPSIKNLMNRNQYYKYRNKKENLNVNSQNQVKSKS